MFVLKNDSQVMFSTPWGPKGLKRVKNANFKIFKKVIFGKIARTPTEEKVEFWTPKKYSC